MSSYTLHLGDCLEIMPGIPDGSIDAIIADWPYGTTACSWDSVIPLEPLWIECKRVIKPRGAIVLTASQPFTTVLIASSPYFGTKEQWFKYDWVWSKGICSGFLNSKRMPLRKHESILVFFEGAAWYNPQKDKKPEKNKRRAGTSFEGTLQSHKGVYRDGLTRGSSYRGEDQYPVSILDIQATAPCLKSKEVHPTQKPVTLMEYLIKTYTNPGELVLDNTMGSGSTGEACLRTSRRFIGIEKDPGYFEIAQERLQRVEEEMRQPRQLLFNDVVMEKQ